LPATSGNQLPQKISGMTLADLSHWSLYSKICSRFCVCHVVHFDRSIL